MKLYDIVMWDPDGADARELMVYKHEAEDFNTHTQLIVHSSQEAIFYKNGQDLDSFGAGRHTLTTDKLPVLGKIMAIPTDGKTPFHSEVYFINKIVLQDLRWGTPDPVLTLDPMYRIPLHLRANGVFGAHITDGRRFLRQVVGTARVYTKDEFNDYLRGKLVERVKDTVGKVIEEKNLNAFQLNARLRELSDSLKEQLIPFFAEFGITLDNFSFMTLLPLDEDLKKLSDSMQAATTQDIESEAMARKRAREGYTYQQEQTYGVLGKAASNQGTAGGMMGAGMGLGMGFGVGGAFGGAMGGMAQSMNTGNPGGAPAAAPAAETVTCSQCGATLPAGTKFCNECGSKVIPAGMIACPHCGATLAAGAKFCNECGGRVQRVCKNCGKEVPAGAKFCNECGTPQD